MRGGAAALEWIQSIQARDWPLSLTVDQIRQRLEYLASDGLLDRNGAKPGRDVAGIHLAQELGHFIREDRMP